MKKIYLLILAFVALIGFQSCSNNKEMKTRNCGRPPVMYFLINKNSEEYKDLVKAFGKEDYTKGTRKERGYNNIYFSKGDYKAKLHYKLIDISDNSNISYVIELYKYKKIEENYASLIIEGNEFYANTLTGKEESLSLIYDDKEIPFKIKGKLGRCKIAIDEFYVNNKKHRFLNKGRGGVLYLVE